MTATAIATATVIANATATVRTAEFYNWVLIWILRGMLPDMLLHIAVRLLCRGNFTHKIPGKPFFICVFDNPIVFGRSEGGALYHYSI